MSACRAALPAALEYQKFTSQDELGHFLVDALQDSHSAKI